MYKLQLTYIERLIKNIPKIIKKVIIRDNEYTLLVEPENLIKILLFLRNNNNSLFLSLVDIVCIDFPSKDKRFKLIYNLLSYNFESRVRIQVIIGELEYINSVTSLFSSANWLEREVWDLFGIYFSNHPDLRRILTDYGFEGFPLRKDFPITGFVQLRYDDEKKSVLYESLEVAQGFRAFNFLSPWEQINNFKNLTLKNNG